MSKKPEASLTRLSERSLRPLHDSLRAAFPELHNGLIGAPAKVSRKRAFNGTTSHRWFKHNYVRSQALKRYQQGSIPAAQRVAEAIRGYMDTEEVCRVANAKLYGALENSALVSPRLVEVLKRAHKAFVALVGDIELSEVFNRFAFSAGATTEFRRADASVQHKWAKGAHITQEALPLLSLFSIWAGAPFDHRFSPVVVRGAEYFTVLKNYEKDRSCEKQPTLNMALQKAVGGCIRSRLNRVGLLLPEAQVQHQALAKQASVTGHLATGDLSSASDCISLALVDTLSRGTTLAGLMAATRCNEIEMPDGKWLTLEKISSMGNGFTFELETALFYCLLKAVCGKDTRISVFGDDLIYPVEYSQDVIWAFTELGFTFNTEKTFDSGLFRESCGGHYYGGHDVKPFYIEQLPTTYGQVINLHNDIVAYHVNMPPNGRYLAVAAACRRLIPKSFWGPFGVAGTLWSEWDEATPRYQRRTGRRELSRSLSGPEVGAIVTSRYVPGPCYQRWVVKSISYVVPRQRHDYYIGSLLSGLWDPFREERRSRSRPRYSLEQIHAFGVESWVTESDLSQAEFWFPASKREVIRTRAVDVACRWKHLPVRVG